MSFPNCQHAMVTNFLILMGHGVWKHLNFKVNAKEELSVLGIVRKGSVKEFLGHKKHTSVLMSTSKPDISTTATSATDSESCGWKRQREPAICSLLKVKLFAQSCQNIDCVSALCKALGMLR